MNAQEQQENRAALLKKYNNEVVKYPPAQRPALRERLQSAFAAPNSGLPGFLRRMGNRGGAQIGR